MTRRLAGIPPAVAAFLLPQAAFAAEGGLQIFPDWTGLLPIMIGLFLVLIVPCQKLLFVPLIGVLEERRARIQGRQERAQVVGGEADEVKGRYQAQVETARGGAQDARREVIDGARSSQSRIGNDARATAEQEVTRAREQVAQALEEARGQLREQASTLARDAASQVLGRPLS